MIEITEERQERTIETVVLKADGVATINVILDALQPPMAEVVLESIQLSMEEVAALIQLLRRARRASASTADKVPPLVAKAVTPILDMIREHEQAEVVQQPKRRSYVITDKHRRQARLNGLRVQAMRRLRNGKLPTTIEQIIAEINLLLSRDKSINEVATALNERGVKTVNGLAWTGANLRNYLNRHDPDRPAPKPRGITIPVPNPMQHEHTA